MIFRRFLLLGALLSAATVAGPGCATFKLNLRSVALLQAYDHLKAGRPDAAMAAVEKVERQPDLPAEVRSETAYVKGRVLEAQKRLDEAIAQYRAVVGNYPDTPDSYLARKRLQELGADPAP